MPKVTFKDSGGKEEVAEAAEGAELREVIKTAGWPVAFACEDGVCGTCLTHVSKGMDNLSEMEEREGQTLDIMGMKDGEHRLACQCKVKGDCTIEGM